MIKVNAVGDACPIPVVKTKNAVKELGGAGEVEILVDNEIAVQNIKKMAVQKGWEAFSERLSADRFRVVIKVGETSADSTSEKEEEIVCSPIKKRENKVVAISSDVMGEGNRELGEVLIKSFIFALTKQDSLPDTILFYNGGARLTCEGSPALEDLRLLESMGCEILTCGTCLDFYSLKESLAVGSVTNMYAIAEKLMGADLIIKP